MTTPLLVLAEFGCSETHDPDARLPALVRRGLVQRVRARRRPRPRAQVRELRALDAGPTRLVRARALEVPPMRPAALEHAREPRPVRARARRSGPPGLRRRRARGLRRRSRERPLPRGRV